MTARRYALLDPTQIGAQLELQEGNAVVTFDTDSTTINRMVLGDIAVSAGLHQFECFFYGDEALATRVSVGIVADGGSPVANLATYVGGDADSWGYRAGDGEVRNNGAATETGLPTAVATQCITVELDLDASPPTVTWRLDGLTVHSEAIPAGESWYPAITVSGTTAYGLSALFNGGQRAWTIAPTEGYEDGWSEVLPSIGDLNFAPVGQDYLTGSADDPALTAFDGRILDATQLEIPLGVTFWPWRGQIEGILARTSMRLVNADGAYDYLLAFDGRDARVTLYDLPDDDFANARTIGTLLIESIRADGDDTLTITLDDVQSSLDVPWQTRILPPWVNEGAANRPWPVALGACRNVEPLLTSLSIDGTPVYTLHDREIDVVSVRDKGDVLDPGVPDYELTSFGFQVAADPQGLVTCDASGTGEVPLPDSPVDVLGGIGDFETWSIPPGSGEPDGWDTNNAQRSGAVSPYGAQILSPNSAPFAEAYLEADSTASPSPLLEAGKRYRVEYRAIMDHDAGPTDTVNPWFYAKQVGGSDFMTVQIPGSGVYAHTVTCPAGADTIIGWVVATNANIDIHRMTVREVRAYELPSAPALASEIEGIGLADYVQAVVDRCRDTVVAAVADCDAIDTATGYPIGAYLGPESRSIIDAISLPLDAFTAGAFCDENGSLRFVRLVAPEDAGASDVIAAIERDQILAPPRIEYDRAPGLTTAFGLRRNWRQFSATDFVTDYDPVTGVDAATRTAFQRPTQRVVQSGQSLAQAYRHAERAPALVTAHEAVEAAQAEVDRVCAMYGQLRRFATLTAAWDDEVPLIHPGDIITVDWPRYGLDGGRQVFVVSIRPRHWARQATLTVWW